MTRRPEGGFTLIELAVVLLILSLVVAILLPRLPKLTGSERTAALRRLLLTAQATHEEAAVKKKAWPSPTGWARTPTCPLSSTPRPALTYRGAAPRSGSRTV